MKLQCPNCSNTKDLSKSLDELYRCDLCSEVCCWSCEYDHVKKYHFDFTELDKSQLEQFKKEDEN